MLTQAVLFTWGLGLSMLSEEDGRPPTNSARLSSSDVSTTSVEYRIELFSWNGEAETQMEQMDRFDQIT